MKHHNVMARRSAVGAVFVTALLLIAGCATPSDDGGTGSDEPVYGGIAVVGEGGSWPTIDPHTVNTNNGPFNHVFETLFDYRLVDAATGKHELVGLLAEDWSTDDPTKLEITLRQGIKFTDGSDWNADVAKFNLDRIRETKEGIGYANIQVVESVDIVDDYKIVLNLTAPSPALLIHLSHAAGVGTSMISKEAFENGTDEVSKFVGTGPFMIDEFVLDDHTSTVKNPDYWRKDSEGRALPYLDGINFRPITDTAVKITELRAGTVNLAGNVPATDLTSIASDPTLRYVPYNGTQLQIGYTGFNTETGAFADPNIRLAAMLATDRQVLADTVGYEAVARELPNFGPVSIGWDEELDKAWDFDLDKAISLVEASGTTPTGTITFQAREPDQTIATILQQMWAAAGIQVDLLPAESALWVENMRAGNFDVSIWGGNVPPDPALALAAFSCGGASNWSNYCNDELQEVYTEGGSVYDEAERAAKYQEALKIVSEEVPFGAVFAQNRNHVETANLIHTSRSWYFYDLIEAWFAE
jgi:peptide/nickel transport system substrate-binding protein